MSDTRVPWYDKPAAADAGMSSAAAAAAAAVMNICYHQL